MKLVMAIIQDRDAEATLDNLNRARFRVTRIATSGGFLHEGNTTLLIGVEDTQVEKVLQVFKETSHRRTMYMPMAAGITEAAYGLHSQVEVEVGGATVFVIDVEHYEQI